MDDLGWPGQKAWHLGDCRLEVAGADVGFTGRAVRERFDVHVNRGIVDAAIPIETDVARLGASGRV